MTIVNAIATNVIGIMSTELIISPTPYVCLLLAVGINSLNQT